MAGRTGRSSSVTLPSAVTRRARGPAVRRLTSEEDDRKVGPWFLPGQGFTQKTRRGGHEYFFGDDDGRRPAPELLADLLDVAAVMR